MQKSLTVSMIEVFYVMLLAKEGRGRVTRILQRSSLALRGSHIYTLHNVVTQAM